MTALFCRQWFPLKPKISTWFSKEELIFTPWCICRQHVAIFFQQTIWLYAILSNFFKKCFLFLFLKISRKFWTQKYCFNAVAKCALLDKKEWPYISFFCTQKLSLCCILMYLSMHQIFQQVIKCACKYSNHENDF